MEITSLLILGIVYVFILNEILIVGSKNLGQEKTSEVAVLNLRWRGSVPSLGLSTTIVYMTLVTMSGVWKAAILIPSLHQCCEIEKQEYERNVLCVQVKCGWYYSGGRWVSRQ